MGKILTEEGIERACIDRLCPDKYDFINAYSEYNINTQIENIQSINKGGIGRKTLKEVMLLDILLNSLKRINPQIPEDILREINYKNYKLIKDDIRIEYEVNGEKSGMLFF